ncbi:MAG TPA: response regulator [Bdellovibrionota bacterium]|jgi:two-component system chemotaxis response regulator CheY
MFSLNTKVLVVDDMLTMRKIVIKHLKDLGFTDIVEAVDGKQAYSVLEAASPPVQLVVSDWNMPNCTGIELLKKVRHDARFAKLPFVMLTAEAEAHQVKEALEARVTGYVLKPFTKETLQQKLEAAAKAAA